MILSDSITLAPFSVNLVDGQRNCVVNVGYVNPYIYNNYKQKSFTWTGAGASNELYFIDLLSGIKQPVDETVFSPMGDSGPIFKMGTSYSPTFTASPGDCSIYLTIPKIPLGFDHLSSFNAGKQIWWLDSKVDFLNQFEIITSSDTGFSGNLSGNLKYIEKENRFRDPDFDYFGRTDVRYKEYVAPDSFGKVYIKLADLSVGSSVSVNPFFRSNVVNPSKYIRNGALGLRYIKICYTTINLNSFSFLDAKPEIGPLPDIFSTSADSTFYYPPFFTKTLEEIREDVEVWLKEYVETFNNLYINDIPYLFPDEPDLRLEPADEEQAAAEPLIENLTVFSIWLIYKKNLGEKVIIENILEDTEGFDIIYEKAFKKNFGEETEFDATPLRRMKESEVLEELGITADEGLVSLVGFVSDETE